MTSVASKVTDTPTSSAWRRWRSLLALLRPHWLLLVGAIAAGIANQALNVSSAVVGAYLVGAAITGASAEELSGGVLVLVALVVPRVAMPWLDTALAHIMTFRTLVDVRARVYAAFERLAPGYLLRRRSGDLGAAVIADVEILEIFFSHTLSPLVVATVVPLGATLALLAFDPLLPLVLAPFVLTLASVPAWLRRRAERQGREYRDALGELNAEVVDSVQGLREVVSFGHEGRQLERLTTQHRRLHNARVAHGRRAGIEHAAIDSLVLAGMLAVLLAASVLVLAGRLPPALFPPSVILAAFAFAPVATLTSVLRELNVVSAAADRIFTLLHEVAPVADQVDMSPARPIEPRVTFDRVRFRYAADLPDAVSDVSFTIDPGETVALVGRSGAGKSTCAHLLLRFWEVSGGAVRVGGHDLRDFRQDDLRRLLAFVPQDVYLFNIAIRDNIRLARPDAADAEVEAAARAALAHDFIVDELRDGYDTIAGERGAQLSGGQRQRIAIARALLTDAPILVMDEAVSNLDAESELALQAAAAHARRGRTTLIIAHRLSTIRSADRIAVLDAGRLVEEGTHEMLLARGATYAELIASQQLGVPAHG